MATAKSYLGQTTLPRGLRNNNPGNIILTSIKWQGKIPNAQNTDGVFEQFSSLSYGIRALAMDIINDVNEGTNTIETLITEFAPPSENNTAAYILGVSNKLGIPKNQPLSLSTTVLSALIRAIAEIENGKTAATMYLTDEDINNGIGYLPAAILQRIGFFVKQNGKSIAGFFLPSR